mgnify:CR=1 FL=1
MKRSQAIKEIKQLKELLDSGVLTQDEYDQKAKGLKKIIMQDEKKFKLRFDEKDQKLLGIVFLIMLLFWVAVYFVDLSFDNSSKLP